MNTVTFEQARALAALGYPQGEWPQVVWLKWPKGTASDRFYLEYDDDKWVGLRQSAEVYAAPHPVDALVWLEQHRGVFIGRTPHLSTDAEWWAQRIEGDMQVSTIKAATATDLLDAVLKVLTKEA